MENFPAAKQRIREFCIYNGLAGVPALLLDLEELVQGAVIHAMEAGFIAAIVLELAGLVQLPFCACGARRRIEMVDVFGFFVALAIHFIVERGSLRDDAPRTQPTEQTYCNPGNPVNLPRFAQHALGRHPVEFCELEVNCTEPFAPQQGRS